jgi:V/A-type H+/Na+-transporting ATPase subunit D
MTKITLNKSTYLAEAKKLKSFERFLPPLDLKRKQLLLERNKARDQLQALQVAIQTLSEQVQNDLPMLANTEVGLDHLVTLGDVTVVQDNILGVSVPRLENVNCVVREYGLLSKPHWVDTLVKQLHSAVELRVQHTVHHQRVQLLDQAVRKATQRVNLIAKVLIPESQAKMRKIRIYLADNERASVIRSKLAKRKKRVAEIDAMALDDTWGDDVDIGLEEEGLA